jgi:hypothetical protein
MYLVTAGSRLAAKLSVPAAPTLILTSDHCNERTSSGTHEQISSGIHPTIGPLKP